MFKYDERETAVNGKIADIGLTCVILFLIIKIVYYLMFTTLTDYHFLIWDVCLLVGIIIWIFAAIRHYKAPNLLVPIIFGGRLLTSEKSFYKRYLKGYLPKSILMTMVITIVITFIRQQFDPVMIVSNAFAFLIMYHIICILYGEWIIRKFNKQEEHLDD